MSGNGSCEVYVRILTLLPVYRYIQVYTGIYRYIQVQVCDSTHRWAGAGVIELIREREMREQCVIDSQSDSEDWSSIPACEY